MDNKKIVLRVSINCIKCKTEVLKSVAKLQGINQVSVNSEKGELTVIGNVDPVVLTKQLRKNKKAAHIISVGPHKKDDEKLQQILKPLPIRCGECQLVAVGIAPHYQPPLCPFL